MITIDFTRLGIKPSYKILDVGCGTGRHTSAASRFKNVTVIGTDIRFNDSVEARNRITLDKKFGFNGGGKCVIITSDIRHLPFDDKLFDIVICSEVLEHIPEHETCLFLERG